MSGNSGEAKGVDFLVDRQNLRNCKFVHPAAPGPGAVQPGEVLLRVAHFAFTANNLTYAVAGDMMSYWNFFPAEPGWGKVPVWGFGDVVRSRHDGVAVGERVFGYFPMSTHLMVRPDNVVAASFVDAAPHRTALPPVYNQYVRTAHDPTYTPETEDQHMLFRPLFLTAFLLDDFLAENAFFGARAVVLSSASSKTAFGLAFLLHTNRRAHTEVIGLTSFRNLEFVESLGCYDRVVTYEEVRSLPARVPVAFVDMAGDGAVVSAVHHHFEDNLKHSCIVGLTHWEQRASGGEVPGVQPTLFFAPTQLQQRMRNWGPEGFQQRYATAWQRFLAFTKDRIRVVHGQGEAAVEGVYRDMLEGRTRPDEGHILSL